MKNQLVGRGSPRHPLRRGEPRPTVAMDAANEDRAILSFTLLLAVLVAGFVISLGNAEPNAALSAIFIIQN